MAMYEKQQNLVDQVLSQMQVCEDMLGICDEEKREIYGFVPGLNESGKAKELEERIQSIKKGIFMIMFTGCFNAGKSTLLNALMHSELLATGNLPETAVITKIIFNADEEKAVIYKRDEVDENGRPVTQVMEDIHGFFEKYHVDPNDKSKFLRLVDHVEIYQKRDGIAGSMVQLVDSPGTRASVEDDEVSMKFIKKADAVVFLISALQALDKEDKDYIASNFANRQMRNVFFVVNKVNQVNSEEELNRLKKYVREELNDVFIDKQGSFNQALFESRVFYVDAYGAMNTRVGKKTPITMYYKAMIPEETTGVPEFENALGKFLTDGDKDKVALEAYRSQIANMYVAAEMSAENQLDMLRQGEIATKARLEEYRKDKGRIEREIQDIKEDIERTEKDIVRDAKDAYDSFISSVETDWDGYFSDKAGSMGIHSMKMLIAQVKKWLLLWENKEEREKSFQEETMEATREFSDGIKAFLEIRQNEMSQELENLIRKDVTALTVKLENHQKSLENFSVPVDIDQILAEIAAEQDIKIKGAQENNSNLAQAFLAILFADPELMVTAAGGDKGTVEFVVEIIKTNITDVVITSVLSMIIGNVLAIAAFVIMKIFKTFVRGENITERLIRETKETILDGYTDKNGEHVEGIRGERKDKYISRTKAVIGGALLRTGEKLTNSIQEKLDMTEHELENSLNLLETNQHAFESETERVGFVLDRMAAAISEISILTSDTALSKDEIKALSASKKE